MPIFSHTPVTLTGRCPRCWGPFRGRDEISPNPSEPRLDPLWSGFVKHPEAIDPGLDQELPLVRLSDGWRSSRKRIAHAHA